MEFVFELIFEFVGEILSSFIEKKEYSKKKKYIIASLAFLSLCILSAAAVVIAVISGSAWQIALYAICFLAFLILYIATMVNIFRLP